MDLCSSSSVLATYHFRFLMEAFLSVQIIMAENVSVRPSQYSGKRHILCYIDVFSPKYTTHKTIETHFFLDSS